MLSSIVDTPAPSSRTEFEFCSPRSSVSGYTNESRSKATWFAAPAVRRSLTLNSEDSKQRICCCFAWTLFLWFPGYSALEQRSVSGLSPETKEGPGRKIGQRKRLAPQKTRGNAVASKGKATFATSLTGSLQPLGASFSTWVLTSLKGAISFACPGKCFIGDMWFCPSLTRSGWF